jgi:hypothetical protein
VLKGKIFFLHALISDGRVAGFRGIIPVLCEEREKSHVRWLQREKAVLG